MFNLSEKLIVKLLSKLIFQKKLNAALDYRGKCLIFYRKEISKIQLKGKRGIVMVKNLVDVNEKLLDKKGGIYGFKDEAPNISYYQPTKR